MEFEQLPIRISFINQSLITEIMSVMFQFFLMLCRGALLEETGSHQSIIYLFILCINFLQLQSLG